MIFELEDLDYQILLTVLIDASQDVGAGSAREATLDDLRYKLQRQHDAREDAVEITGDNGN